MYYIKIYVEVPSWNMLENPSKPNIDGPCRVERLENLRLYQAQMEFALLAHGYSQTWLNNSAMGLEEQLGHAGRGLHWFRESRSLFFMPYVIIYYHLHMCVCVCEPRYNK